MTSAARLRLEGYTLADWDELDPTEGRRVELHHGRFVVSAAPKPRHQRIADRLRTLLDAAVTPRDLEALTAIGVRVAADVAYIPDVTVAVPVADEVTSVGAHEVSLVVEVVSPGSQRMDRVEKPAAMAAAGIPRYWRIELRDHEPPEIVSYGLVDDVYAETAVVTAGKPQMLEVANGVHLDIDVDELDRRR